MRKYKGLIGSPLILVDLQCAIDHSDWGARNNPEAESNIAALLAHWRQHDWPIIHIRHDSFDPKSHYAPNQPGHDFKPQTQPISGETIIGKQTNSAFVDTELHQYLLDQGHDTIVVVGVITNNSIETTVRHGGNLGLKIYLMADGCFTFDRVDWNGKHWPAEDVHALSLSNMDGEYCQVIQTADIL